MAASLLVDGILKGIRGLARRRKWRTRAMGLLDGLEDLVNDDNSSRVDFKDLADNARDVFGSRERG